VRGRPNNDGVKDAAKDAARRELIARSETVRRRSQEMIHEASVVIAKAMNHIVRSQSLLMATDLTRSMSANAPRALEPGDQINVRGMVNGHPVQLTWHHDAVDSEGAPLLADLPPFDPDCFPALDGDNVTPLIRDVLRVVRALDDITSVTIPNG